MKSSVTKAFRKKLDGLPASVQEQKHIANAQIQGKLAEISLDAWLCIAYPLHTQRTNGILGHVDR
ncbi:hypothetical protein A4S05_09530 [Nostoc sp. KVJ20]|uniref:hypothetical protein n=1 Tax=Nostoc sp. KVJ20 TaxID=457944 RepID=UPI00083D440C|nr:hypothetical protein [Nostoc sp. KVJ20]ODG98300.1 hypothetical protein A4S05_09530 [Nostoc sp. KVJ20]